jgi:mono/diheme cytochrome c family protein
VESSNKTIQLNGRNAMRRVFLRLPLLIIAGLGTAGLAIAAEQATPTTAPGSAAAPQAGQAPAPAASTQQGQAPAGGQAQNAGQQAATEPASGNPQDLAKSAEKGTLKTPYPDFASVAKDGQAKYMAAGCNGCHGGTGGGGMGPPLTNPVWIYGSDDDTLFRLIALGSDELKKQGYVRKGSENVVGPMPQMGTVIKSDDDMWKIIAWIRSVNPSSATSASVAPAPPPPAQ